MEDTLRVKTKSVMYLLIMVLILVLMEDTLRDNYKNSGGLKMS